MSGGRPIIIWRAVALAVAMAALTACGNNSGPDAQAPLEEAAPEPALSGDAGVAQAFAGLSGDQLTALHIQHLNGFVMAAAAVTAENRPADAAAIVQQGLREAYDKAPDAFGDLNVDIIRGATDSRLNRAQMMQRIRAADAEIVRVLSELDMNYAVLVVRMIDIANSTYYDALQASPADPAKYQYSMGAALAARASLNQDALMSRNLFAYLEAQGELNRLVQLWPQTTPPQRPAPYAQVAAQGMRVRRALDPWLGPAQQN